MCTQHHPVSLTQVQPVYFLVRYSLNHHLEHEQQWLDPVIPFQPQKTLIYALVLSKKYIIYFFGSVFKFCINRLVASICIPALIRPTRFITAEIRTRTFERGIYCRRDTTKYVENGNIWFLPPRYGHRNVESGISCSRDMAEKTMKTTTLVDEIWPKLCWKRQLLPPRYGQIDVESANSCRRAIAKKMLKMANSCCRDMTNNMLNVTPLAAEILPLNCRNVQKST